MKTIKKPRISGKRKSPSRVNWGTKLLASATIITLLSSFGCRIQVPKKDPCDMEPSPGISFEITDEEERSPALEHFRREYDEYQMKVAEFKRDLKRRGFDLEKICDPTTDQEMLALIFLKEEMRKEGIFPDDVCPPPSFIFPPKK